jgi:Sialidase-like, CBM domain
MNTRTPHPARLSARAVRAAAAAAFAAALAAFASPAAGPPIVYAGHAVVAPDADGDLPPVVGVHNIEVVRSNRTHPQWTGSPAATYTYLHQPMLAYWRGKFYLEYLTAPRDEGQAPCPTLLVTSADGVHWSKPRVVFPTFTLPDGQQTVTHQRMGFHVAADGRLLILAFHGKSPHPNDGSGIGRVIREIRPDGGFGPIYFIRYNRQNGWNPSNTPYPLYTASPDPGFVADCRALLANKLVTAQWWEEDRSTDGFYRIEGQALSYMHRKDGAVVGIFKNALVSTTRDEGRTWTPKQFAGNLWRNASKYWLQRTSDGRYALFLNPTDRLRFPLAVLTSDDGVTFRHLLAVHGELPDQRHVGGFKNLGAQYVRGIAEGNGTPPGDACWVAYSVNKEDIWISRVPVPIRGSVGHWVDDTFEDQPVGSMPDDWNLYVPKWTRVQVVDAGGAAGHALELLDQEPYDYARAVRVFPQTHGVDVSFKVLARQTDARLEIDLMDAHGLRPVRLAFEEDGRLWACHEGIWKDAGRYAAGRWISIGLTIAKNPRSDHAVLTVDGRQPLGRTLVFSDPARTVERLSFRTGRYRRRGEGPGYDLPRADVRAPASVFLVDDVVIRPVR